MWLPEAHSKAQDGFYLSDDKTHDNNLKQATQPNDERRKGKDFEILPLFFVFVIQIVHNAHNTQKKHHQKRRCFPVFIPLVILQKNGKMEL